MKFATMIDNGGLITFVPPSLQRTYTKLGYEVIDAASKCAWTDRGGAILADAHQVEVDVGSAIVRVPARDIEFYAEKLRKAPLLDGTHYRLEGHWTAIVLTPDQRYALLKCWQLNMPATLMTAALEAKRFAAALNAIELHNQPMPSPEALN